MSFLDKLQKAQADTGSVLVVGLDPDPERFPTPLAGQPPVEATEAFCRAIVRATHEAACGYKFNLAFFEALGASGVAALERLVEAVPGDRMVILDGKRGDIGNTARRYASAMFDSMNADACTVAPYMGEDAVAPFLDVAGRCTFVLCKTSNPSSSEFQEQVIDGRPLYEHVAERVKAWAAARPGLAGLVVGATQPEALARLRALLPEAPFLIPGVGAQGGDPRIVMEAAGGGPVLVNASRAVLYASSGPDFAEAARDSAAALRDRLARAR